MLGTVMWLRNALYSFACGTIVDIAIKSCATRNCSMWKIWNKMNATSHKNILLIQLRENCCIAIYTSAQGATKCNLTVIQ